MIQIFQFEALRVHYCVDIFTGAIVAHYIFILVERYIFVVDKWVFGIPLEKRMGTVSQIQTAKAQEIKA